MSEAISGMTLTCTSCVEIIWLEDVFLMNKFPIFYSLVMLQHMVDTLEDTEQQQKFFKQLLLALYF